MWVPVVRARARSWGAGCARGCSLAGPLEGGGTARSLVSDLLLPCDRMPAPGGRPHYPANNRAWWTPHHRGGQTLRPPAPPPGHSSAPTPTRSGGLRPGARVPPAPEPVGGASAQDDPVTSRCPALRAVVPTPPTEDRVGPTRGPGSLSLSVRGHPQATALCALVTSRHGQQACWAPRATPSPGSSWREMGTMSPSSHAWVGFPGAAQSAKSRTFQHNRQTEQLVHMGAVQAVTELAPRTADRTGCVGRGVGPTSCLHGGKTD